MAEDFEVWTDLLSRRAAVLWVLKSVYVRVLEDRGLLAPGRLLDPESQQLFERLAPNLGETAFLRWIYRDLASKEGGLPELFSPQAAEVALPSDELSRGLIAFWRHRDADSGATWSFAHETFEGELMGDLYQELDPVVKDRFALCQTPDFVRGFILDRTLTPAIETFGAGVVRVLDPACGSGHFLIDALKRLVSEERRIHHGGTEARREEESFFVRESASPSQPPNLPLASVPPCLRGESPSRLVQGCLDRIVGIDLNDYACGLARARLIMTAADLAGVTTLAEAAQFHPHVYWADGLEQIERDEVKPSVQFGLFEGVPAEEKPRAALTRSDVRAELKKVFAKRFHAVVANPPYIVESDEARKDYHREKLGKAQRYVSAYRQYSLGSPFTERCFQLAEKDGYVGLITSNNFMKREFGKPLIEKILAGVDLTLVVDTSQAYIPFHGTPTVLLFGRNRRPTSDTVRAVMGKRGESGTPEDPAKGRVWASIVDGWDTVGFETEYASVADLPRETLGKHPWSLGGGGAAELKERISTHARERLSDVSTEIGRTTHTGLDEVFLLPSAYARRICGDRHWAAPGHG
ncbi:MAG: Eco57I restriction-modification methylase domain-containing protein [Myxococcales bacterium]|nr:Eco57I restriction-modification methylase domain-containing protein [Myxococcales bacterium]